LTPTPRLWHLLTAACQALSTRHVTRDGNGYTPAHLLARAEPSPSTLGLIKRLGAVDSAAFLVGSREGESQHQQQQQLRPAEGDKEEGSGQVRF